MKSRETLIGVCILVAAVVSLGCGDKKGETPGYTKKDFEKTAPPAGYLGSVPKGPAVAPPSNAGK